MIGDRLTRAARDAVSWGDGDGAEAGANVALSEIEREIVRLEFIDQPERLQAFRTVAEWMRSA